MADASLFPAHARKCSERSNLGAAIKRLPFVGRFQTRLRPRPGKM